MAEGKKKVYVAGHRGLVGSAVERQIASRGEPPPLTRTRSELDLLDARAVNGFFREHRPDVVVLAAAKVGGIWANSRDPWHFIHENLAIENNVIAAAVENRTQRLVFLGSSCIYPRDAVQPLTEDALLTGPLESTNEAYAVAKIAGIKLVEAAAAQFGARWVSLMPTNLYGPGDNFHPDSSHVVPAMMHKFHQARLDAVERKAAQVTLWGDGAPMRELLHVDDLARAILEAACDDITGLFNVGSEEEISISGLAELMAETVGCDPEIRWDRTRPNGTPRKKLDSSKFREATGWRPRIALADGLRSTYKWYLENVAGSGAGTRAAR